MRGQELETSLSVEHRFSNLLQHHAHIRRRVEEAREQREIRGENELYEDVSLLDDFLGSDYLRRDDMFPWKEVASWCFAHAVSRFRPGLTRDAVHSGSGEMQVDIVRALRHTAPLIACFLLVDERVVDAMQIRWSPRTEKDRLHNCILFVEACEACGVPLLATASELARAHDANERSIRCALAQCKLFFAHFWYLLYDLFQALVGDGIRTSEDIYTVEEKSQPVSSQPFGDYNPTALRASAHELADTLVELDERVSPVRSTLLSPAKPEQDVAKETNTTQREETKPDILRKIDEDSLIERYRRLSREAKEARGGKLHRSLSSPEAAKTHVTRLVRSPIGVRVDMSSEPRPSDSELLTEHVLKDAEIRKESFLGEAFDASTDLEMDRWARRSESFTSSKVQKLGSCAVSRRSLSPRSVAGLRLTEGETLNRIPPVRVYTPREVEFRVWKKRHLPHLQLPSDISPRSLRDMLNRSLIVPYGKSRHDVDISVPPHQISREDIEGAKLEHSCLYEKSFAFRSSDKTEKESDTSRVSETNRMLKSTSGALPFTNHLNPSNLMLNQRYIIPGFRKREERIRHLSQDDSDPRQSSTFQSSGLYQSRPNVSTSVSSRHATPNFLNLASSSTSLRNDSIDSTSSLLMDTSHLFSHSHSDSIDSFDRMSPSALHLGLSSSNIYRHPVFCSDWEDDKNSSPSFFWFDYGCWAEEFDLLKNTEILHASPAFIRGYHSLLCLNHPLRFHPNRVFTEIDDKTKKQKSSQIPCLVVGVIPADDDNTESISFGILYKLRLAKGILFDRLVPASFDCQLVSVVPCMLDGVPFERNSCFCFLPRFQLSHAHDTLLFELSIPQVEYLELLRDRSLEIGGSSFVSCMENSILIPDAPSVLRGRAVLVHRRLGSKILRKMSQSPNVTAEFSSYYFPLDTSAQYAPFSSILGDLL